VPCARVYTEAMARPTLCLAVALALAACTGHHAAPVDAGADMTATPAPPDLGVPPPTADRNWPPAGSTRVCQAPARPSVTSAIDVVPAFPGLTFAWPLGITQAPGDPSRFFVWQQEGDVRVFPATATQPSDVTSFVNLANKPGGIVAGNAGAEYGLLGMTFHPQWQTNHLAFLSYDGPSTLGAPAGFDSVISRFRSRDGGATLSLATGDEEELVRMLQPYTNHNGGNILFGPDGYLYIGFGDGGAGGDPANVAQNLSTWLGKMLRIDVDQNLPGYAIPPTNPFANGDGMTRLREIYAFGLRNPWRWSFDRGTGDLWLGDVGQNAWEEVDQLKLGGNYGWRVFEGTHC